LPFAIQNIRIEKPWHTAGAFFAVCAAVSLHFSPAFSSIFGVLAFLSAMVALVQEGVTADIKTSPLWLLLIFVLWQFFADSLSANPIAWNKWLMRVPLLLIPLSLYWRISYLLAVRFILLLALPLVWIDLASMLNYALHSKFYNQMVLESKPIPVYSLVYHIEFSVYQALLALSLLHVLLQKNQNTIGKMLRGFVMSCFIIVFVSLHVLSARTGLLMFWFGAAGLFWLRLKLLNLSRWKILGIAVLMMVLVAVVPSLRNRIVNTVHDFTAVVYSKDLNHQSFGQRWEAWNAALNAAKVQPIVGHGLDHVHEAMSVAYNSKQSHLDELNRINPHNQFLEVAVQSGYLAAILLLVAFIWIAIQGYKKHNTKTLSIIVLSIAIAMCFESLLERQAGTWVVVLALSGLLFPNNSNK